MKNTHQPNGLRTCRAAGIVLAVMLSACGSEIDLQTDRDAADATNPLSDGGMLTDQGAAGMGGNTNQPQGGQGGVAPNSPDGGVFMEGTDAGGAMGGMPAELPGTGGAPAPLPNFSPMSLCDRLCQRQKECDMMEDHQTCLAACTNANAAVVPKLRSDVLQNVDTCVASADCRTILKGQTLAECLTVAAAAIAPSAKVTSLCEEYFGRADECLGAVGKAECLGTAKVYADTQVGQASGCLAKDCALVNPCFQATLNGAEGPRGIGAGVPSIRLCQGAATSCSYLSSYSSYDSDRCSKQKGCTGNTGCSGTLQCYYANSQSLCSDIGCSWSNSNSYDRCTGTPSKTCSSMTSRQACDAAFPCSWRTECSGAVVACDKIHATSCAEQAGCTVR